MVASVTAAQRFTPRNLCPVCGGHDRLPRGGGDRCYGFLSADGKYAHCSREDHAGGLPLESGSDTYAHRLAGSCRCGVTHGEAEPDPATIRRNGAGRQREYRELGPNVAEYLYPDADGQLWHRVTRHRDPKDFCPWHGGPAAWKKGEGGKKLPPYRLPELLAAEPSAWVLIVEGEKDVDRLIQLGYVATTNAGGASKWRPELSEFLRGRRVCILPDYDDAGEQDAESKGQSLHRIAADVRVLRLPDLPDKGDVSDWLDAGGTPQALDRLIEDAPAWEPAADAGAKTNSSRVRFVTAREFAQETPAQTSWAVEPYVPVGGTTKVDGAPKKAGKTTLITHMVAAVLDGTDFLGKPTKHGPVVLLTEQGSTSFRESLARANLLERDDLYLAIYRDFFSLDWPDVVDQAFALVADVGAALFVVDTLPACAGVRGDDENSAGRALGVMEPVQVGADTHGVGVVISFHDRKDGGEVGDSGRGSNAYAGAVDVVLRVTKPGGNFSPAIRKIEALSRFEATPAELYIELTETGYVSLGGEADVVSAAVARTLADVLPTTEADAKPMSAVTKDKEIVERGILDELAARGIKAARSTVDTELGRWIEAGHAGQTGEGKKGSPYRFWLVTKPAADFFRSKTPDPSEERIAQDAATEPQGGAQRDSMRQKDSSDAPPPSEERKTARADAGEDEPFLSSDAPDGYDGTNHQGAEPARVCVQPKCGAPIPDNWRGHYCGRHGGRPPDAGANAWAGAERVRL